MYGITALTIPTSLPSSSIDKHPPKLTPLQQWEMPFEYKNLKAMAECGEIVWRSPSNDFYVLTHPQKVNDSTKGSDYLGWKLRISVHQKDYEAAFNLAAPILKQYCDTFKVIDPTNTANERFLQGAQFTIYLEHQGKSIIKPENVEKMIEEINQAFLKNSIRTGVMPDSDAPTRWEFFSIRNDKQGFIFASTMSCYISSNLIGKNYNPSNYPNPFRNLLSGDQSFDPIKHFHSFQCSPHDDCTRQFFLTLEAYVREYTTIHELDKESREMLVAECKAWFEDGTNINGKYFNDASKTNSIVRPEIQLGVTQALILSMSHSTGTESDRDAFIESVKSIQFSNEYPYENSFKDLLVALEEHVNRLSII
jgi:hypothetical protein